MVLVITIITITATVAFITGDGSPDFPHFIVAAYKVKFCAIFYTWRRWICYNIIVLKVQYYFLFNREILLYVYWHIFSYFFLLSLIFLMFDNFN